MRLAYAAGVLCLSALSLGILALAAPPATPQSAAPAPSAASPAAPASAAPSSAAPAATTPVSASVAGDAAARHVKRTACLKEAKAKKLVGADKTAFLKTCIEAPQEPVSASRQILPDRP
jgi:hypothetical protein